MAGLSTSHAVTLNPQESHSLERVAHTEVDRNLASWSQHSMVYRGIYPFNSQAVTTHQQEAGDHLLLLHAASTNTLAASSTLY
jgi:hypothetical protein